jgi:hypothetical protein
MKKRMGMKLLHSPVASLWIVGGQLGTPAEILLYVVGLECLIFLDRDFPQFEGLRHRRNSVVNGRSTLTVC